MKNNRNTVLIVDDEINICEVIRLYVEKEGFDSVIAHDGVTAIDKFKQTKPDIVLRYYAADKRRLAGMPRNPCNG